MKYEVRRTAMAIWIENTETGEKAYEPSPFIRVRRMYWYKIDQLCGDLNSDDSDLSEKISQFEEKIRLQVEQNFVE